MLRDAMPNNPGYTGNSFSLLVSHLNCFRESTFCTKLMRICWWLSVLNTCLFRMTRVDAEMRRCQGWSSKSAFQRAVSLMTRHRLLWKKPSIFLSIKVFACSQIASEIYQLSELYYCSQRTSRAGRRENKLLLLKEGIYMKSLCSYWAGWRRPQLEDVSYQLLLVLGLGTTLSLSVLQLQCVL